MRTKKASALAVTTLVVSGLFAGGTASAQAEGTTPCAPTAKACVDLDSNQAWLQDNGKAVYGPVPMTGGMPGQETPVGVHTVQWKDADHVSGEHNNAPMPNSVFFTTTGIAFHEGSLERESNGCVHLSTTAAKRFFDSLNPGDEVQVVD